MLELNKIYNIDCIAGMKLLDENCVDLIFSSPPFECMREYGEQDELGKLRGDKFVAWFEPFFNECRRIIKPTRNIFINFQGQIHKKEYSLAEQKLPILAVEKCNLKYVQPLYWVKSNARPENYGKRLKNAVELIWHFVKDLDNYQVYKDSVREPSIYAEKDKRKWKYNPLGRDPGNVFFHKKSQNQKTIHPAKMIDELAAFYVKYGSKPGDLVFDPFCGAATTLTAAKQLGRNYLGTELSPEYHKISENRLAEILI